MPDRTTLARLGLLVSTEFASGQLGPNSRAACRFLEAQPETVLDLLDMLMAEARKKRPNEKLVTAYTFMVGQALEFARYASERGFREAVQLVNAVRKTLLATGESGQVEPDLMLTILREFANAKLDPGPELKKLMEHLAEGMGAGALETDGIGTFDKPFTEFAREFGSDPFELHNAIGELAGAFPEATRAAIGAWLLQGGEEAAREAAVGWLLDASRSVRNSAAAGLEHAATLGGVSGVMLRRLIALRNWLPEADRASVDRAIHACRRKGVEISGWPTPQIREILASGVDGAGAQSFFVLAREGRRNAIACLLVKQDIGVRDAWARHGVTRAELDDFLCRLQEIDLFPASVDFIRFAVAHALGVNLRSGIMPPFAMLDVMETAGLQGIQPEARSVDAVLGLLEADPALPRSNEVSVTLTNSSRLPDEIGFLDSWFEADAEVEQLLGNKRLTRQKRIALVQDELLSTRVAKWAERLAWIALLLHEGEEDAPWEEFLVSARELQAGRPISEVPLMAHVAALTVDANEAQHFQRSNLSRPKPHRARRTSAGVRR